MSCFHCDCVANNCEHSCSSCFQSNSQVCMFCLEYEEKIVVEKEMRGIVRMEDVTYTGFGELYASCPCCDTCQKLYYTMRGTRRQLVDGSGSGTCHTMMCNCTDGTTSMSGVQASLLEDFLVMDNRVDYYGEGSASLNSAYEMRCFLQKDQPDVQFKSGDQFPQHLSQLACEMMDVKLTNYKIVLGDVGDQPYTIVNNETQ
jgi:hypothetical protein